MYWLWLPIGHNDGILLMVNHLSPPASVLPPSQTLRLYEIWERDRQAWNTSRKSEVWNTKSSTWNQFLLKFLCDLHVNAWFGLWRNWQWSPFCWCQECGANQGHVTDFITTAWSCILYLWKKSYQCIYWPWRLSVRPWSLLSFFHMPHRLFVACQTSSWGGRETTLLGWHHNLL